MPSTSMKGPEPDHRLAVRRLVGYLFIWSSETSFQMCSGTIGIGISGSAALGFDS